MKAIWICLMAPRYCQIWWLIIILSHEKCNKLASKPTPDKLRKASTFIFSVIMAFTYKRGHRGSCEGKNCDVVLWMGNVRPRDSHSCAVLVNLVNLENRLFWACLYIVWICTNTHLRHDSPSQKGLHPRSGLVHTFSPFSGWLVSMWCQSCSPSNWAQAYGMECL